MPDSNGVLGIAARKPGLSRVLIGSKRSKTAPTHTNRNSSPIQVRGRSRTPLIGTDGCAIGSLMSVLKSMVNVCHCVASKLLGLDVLETAIRSTVKSKNPEMLPCSGATTKNRSESASQYVLASKTRVPASEGREAGLMPSNKPGVTDIGMSEDPCRRNASPLPSNTGGSVRVHSCTLQFDPIRMRSGPTAISRSPGRLQL